MTTTKTYTEKLIELLDKQVIVINNEIKKLQKQSKKIKVNYIDYNLVSDSDYLNYNEKRKIEKKIDELEKLKYDLNNNKESILK